MRTVLMMMLIVGMAGCNRETNSNDFPTDGVDCWCFGEPSDRLVVNTDEPLAVGDVWRYEHPNPFRPDASYTFTITQITNGWAEGITLYDDDTRAVSSHNERTIRSDYKKIGQPHGKLFCLICAKDVSDGHTCRQITRVSLATGGDMVIECTGTFGNVGLGSCRPRHSDEPHECAITTQKLDVVDAVEPQRPQPIAHGFLLTPIRWPVEIMRDLPNGLGPGDMPRWEVRCQDLDPGVVFWPSKKAVEVTPNDRVERLPTREGGSK
jgi:hypothetical protein